MKYLLAILFLATIGQAQLTPQGGGGGVVGPASSTDTAVSIFNGTTGKLLSDSTLLYDNGSNEFSVTSGIFRFAQGVHIYGALLVDTDVAFTGGDVSIVPMANNTAVNLGINNTKGIVFESPYDGYLYGKMLDSKVFTWGNVDGTGRFNLPNLTASKLVLTDASKNLISSSYSESDLTTQAAFAEASLSSVTWSGGVAPSGTAIEKYRANRSGNVVSVQFNLQYSIAGTADTKVTFPLPGALPTPTYFGATAINDFDISCSGTILSSLTAGPTTGPTTGFLGKDGSGNPLVTIYGPSGNAVGAVANCQYFIN